MLGDAGFKALLQVFGYMYPGYLCFKDVEAKDHDKLKLWCMYWVLMAAITAVQPITDTLLFFVPLYYSGRLAFACYLWANNLAGANLVYNRYVQPFLLRHEPIVDYKIQEMRSFATELLHSNFARGVQWLQAKMLAALTAAHPGVAHPGVQTRRTTRAHSLKVDTLKAEPAGYAAPAAGFSFRDSFRSASSGFQSFPIDRDSDRDE